MRKLFFLSLNIFFLFFLQLEGKTTIGIFTSWAQELKPWDVDSIKSGVTGSEEAVIYMSQQLATLGYEVIVFGNPPENSIHSSSSANPRFVSGNFQIPAKLDIAIMWRLPKFTEELKNYAKKVYLWPHDTWDSIVPITEINNFDDVLWISEWQREQWSSINPQFAKFTNIFGNGINPEQFQEIKERKNPYSCIYASNYSRGLEVLLETWPKIKKKFPQATLDLYYGWQHWGLLSPEKEIKLRALVKKLEPLGVKDHGMVGHEELTKAFENTSFWTYPCTAVETFCITALKAQLAGAIPVTIQHSALKETVRGGFNCTKPEEYLKTLTKALNEAKNISLSERKKMGQFIINEFTWKGLALKWKALFDTHLFPKEENQTTQISPSTVRTFFSLAQSYMAVKDYDSALKNFENVVKANCSEIPLYPALYNIGILSELLGLSSEKIINNYNLAATNSPSRMEPLFRLSVYYFTQKNYLLAYSLAKLALTLPKPDDSLYREDWIYDYGMLFAFGNAALSLNKTEEAQIAYEQALSHPQLPQEMAQEIQQNLKLLKLTPEQSL